MKWTVVATFAVVLALGATARAAEEKILYCTDTGVNGFAWENGVPSPQQFKPARQVMKVYPSGQRDISWEGFEPSTTRNYRCGTTDWRDLLSCVNTSDPVDMWLFKEMNYTRAWLYGTPVDPVGDVLQIFVAYGKCVDSE